MASRKKSGAIAAVAPPPVAASIEEPKKGAAARRAAPRKKNVIQMPFFLRNGVKVTVEGDVEDFTWDAKHDRLVISTGTPADQIAPGAHPSARILAPPPDDGQEYTDNGPTAEEAAMYRAPSGVIPDMNMPLEAVLKLNRQAQSIASEKTSDVKRGEEN